ncbi:MAG: transposase [Ktedonobacterales bacterium]|nr:transposase [Ktedonobacterales bacterium]
MANDPFDELEAQLSYYTKQCEFHAEQYRRYAQRYQELEATLLTMRPAKVPRPRRIEVDDIPTDVSDHQWERVAALLHVAPHTGRPLADPRRVLNGILYVLLHQCAWSKLPKRYGSHITCWRRLLHWQESGVWRHIVQVLDVPELLKGSAPTLR